MDDVERFRQIQKRLTKLKDEQARREGRIDALLADLKKKFKCTGLAAAKKKRNQLRKQIDAKEANLETLLEEFIAEYGDRFE